MAAPLRVLVVSDRARVGTLLQRELAATLGNARASVAASPGAVEAPDEAELSRLTTSRSTSCSPTS